MVLQVMSVWCEGRKKDWFSTHIGWQPSDQLQLLHLYITFLVKLVPCPLLQMPSLMRAAASSHSPHAREGLVKLRCPWLYWGCPVPCDWPTVGCLMMHPPIHAAQTVPTLVSLRPFLLLT